MGKKYKASGKVMPSGALAAVASLYSLSYISNLVKMSK